MSPKQGIQGGPDALAGLVERAGRSADARATTMVQELLNALSHESINPARPEEDRHRAGEGAFQRFFHDLARMKGLSARFLPTHLDGRPNVEVSAGEAGDARSLLLNGHCDVVAASETGWLTPPFEPELRDGVIYGRGAADAKGPLLALLQALWIVRDIAGEAALGPVTLVSVVDEEAGGRGTLSWLEGRLANGLPMPEAAIVGEPTELRPAVATRGARSWHLRVQGLGAHAGEAHLGHNAVLLGMRYVHGLAHLHERLGAHTDRRLWPDVTTPYVFNLGRVEGGFGYGSVAASCDLEGVVGWVPPDHLESMTELTERTISSVTEADPWLREHPPAFTWGPLAFEAAATDQDHPMTLLFQEVLGQEGLDGTPRGLLAGTDARHLVPRGSIPTVTFGPGRMAHAHAANERLHLESYLWAIKTLATVVLHWSYAPRRGEHP